MKKQYHILNGDSLKQQFPKDIISEKIIARECLVYGNVTANILDELFSVRTKFLSENYSESGKRYYEDIVTEFTKIQHIDKISELWKSYQDNDTKKLLNSTNNLKEIYPFILSAVEAHLARIPNKKYPRRPAKTLIQLTKDLQSENFGCFLRNSINANQYTDLKTYR